MAIIEMAPGDGTRHMVEVKYICSSGPIGESGQCAFCEGDPCADDPGPSLIHDYYKNSKHATTCPFCQGRS